MKDLITENQELKVTNGDLAVEDSGQQHVEMLLISNKGDWKNSPLTGVGITSYMNAPESPSQRRRLDKEIRLQLRFDGIPFAKVEVSSFDSIYIEIKNDE